MARAATTLDPFNAIAEPRRRQLIDALATEGGHLPVNSLVERLGWPQPQVSKHLAVLLKVGLVSVEQIGRSRMYSLNGEELRTVYEWVKTHERFWDHQLLRIKERAERMQREAALKKRPRPR